MPELTTYEQQRDAHREVARKLKLEMLDIDQEIRRCEFAMGAQLNQEGAEQLRAQRAELIKHREMLPGMIIGARAAALRAEGARTQLLADAAQAPFDAAQAEAEEAGAEVARLEAEAEQARARLNEVTLRRDVLQRQFERAVEAAAPWSGDAYRLERDIEPIKPDPFGDGW